MWNPLHRWVTTTTQTTAVVLTAAAGSSRLFCTSHEVCGRSTLNFRPQSIVFSGLFGLQFCCVPADKRRPGPRVLSFYLLLYCFCVLVFVTAALPIADTWYSSTSYYIITLKRTRVLLEQDPHLHIHFKAAQYIISYPASHHITHAVSFLVHSNTAADYDGKTKE